MKYLNTFIYARLYETKQPTRTCVNNITLPYHGNIEMRINIKKVVVAVTSTSHSNDFNEFQHHSSIIVFK